MKQRDKVLLITVILFMFTGFTSASEVWFNNPTNGETMVYYTGYGTTETTIPVNLQYNWYSSTTIYWIKMTDHNGNEYFSNSDDGIPQWWYLTPGTYTWKLDFYEYYLFEGEKLADTDVITCYVKHTLSVKNIFNDDDVNIDGDVTSSGSVAFKFIGDNLAVGAINQTYNGDTYVWKIDNDKSNWMKKLFNSSNNVHLSYLKNYNYTVQSNDNAAIITGYLKIHTLPTTPTISMSGGFGDNPTLTFSGGGSDVDHYVLKKEYDLGSGFNASYVDPASSPYTDTNVEITKFGGDVVARYSIKAVDKYGYESSYSNTVSTSGNSLWKDNNEEQNTEEVKNYGLFSNYPNPFNPTTQIAYQIPKSSHVSLVVYNSLGQEVADLVNKEQPSGKYSVQFDAANLPSGVYFYRIQTGNFVSVKKMLLMK